MVYIRTDANNLVATGHIMRCITIAKKIKTFNEEAVFIVKDDDTVKMIGGKFKYYCLPSHEITDIYNEIPFIREIVANDKNAKILLDLYIFDATYMSLIKSFSKVITFDDIFKEFFPVDMIINYNPHYYIYDYQTRYHNWAGKLLLGESYVPLREMFENACSDENEKVKNIMIICGGGDSNHILHKIEKRICEDELYQNYTFHIIAGFLNSDYDKLVEIAKDKRINIYRNVYDMAAILKKMDIVISAAGTVLFECCKMQVPTIFFCVADNQKDVVKGFGAKDVMIYAGDIRDDEQQIINNIFENIEFLAHNYEIRKKMRKLMGNMIDGKGAERIANAIVTL